MFSIEQKELLHTLGFADTTIDSPTDDDFADIEEKVGDYLVMKCLEENYEPNYQGLICEDILAAIP